MGNGRYRRALRKPRAVFAGDPGRGELGTLSGHVARANPICRLPESRLPSVIVFRGPQVYVTPSRYPSKHIDGKAVPTWNYAIVTVHGRPRFIEDADWLRDHLDSLTNAHEASRALPWKIDDAPQDFTETLIAAIVGVEISVERILGKWKTTQNRPQADKIGVIEGLLADGDDEALAMASLVQKHLKFLTAASLQTPGPRCRAGGRGLRLPWA